MFRCFSGADQQGQDAHSCCEPSPCQRHRLRERLGGRGDVAVDHAGPISESIQTASSIDKQAAAPIKENTCCGLKLLADDVVGPFLRYAGMAEGKGGASPTWMGSCLVVVKGDTSAASMTIQLPAAGYRHTLSPEVLCDSIPGGWKALKFRIELPLRPEAQEASYRVSVRPGQDFAFHLPGTAQAVRWGFYSCSGFTSDVPANQREHHWKGLTPLWDDVMVRHAQAPLHLMVGGGDQLYNDDVWQAPSLQSWQELVRNPEVPKQRKQEAEFTPDMKREVDAYYFHHYCVHFGHASIAAAYATIPQVMTWDDHDIFDGWGSYPRHLQTSRVFQGVFASSLHWYCLFQQHCRPAEKKDVQVVQLGARLVLVLPDQRHKRWIDQIMPLENYMEIGLLGKELPPGVRHVVLVSTVPVVYPHMAVAVSLVKGAAGAATCLKCLGANPLNQFGEPELLDDIKDHWTSPGHKDERRFFIEHLQMLAKFRGLRVTLISGDVHVAASGRLTTWPLPVREGERMKALRHDFRYMEQVVSSAISNPPPPQGMVGLMDYMGGAGFTNHATRHEMVRVFTRDAGPSKQLLNRRNWCEVTELPDPSDDGSMRAPESHIPRVAQGAGSPRGEADAASLAGCQVFSIRIEEEPPAGMATQARVRAYDIQVPPLTPDPATGAYYDPRSAKGAKGVARKAGGWLRCQCLRA